MTLRGFEAGLDEEEKIRPLPGTNAHLEWVRKQKESKEAVDRSLLITPTTVSREPTDGHELTVSRELPVSREPTVSPKRTGSRQLSVSPKLPNQQPDQHISETSGNVTIQSNYMRLDLDVFRVMLTMTYRDKLVYLDLIRRAYGAYPKAKNICSCTYSEISQTSGITARDAISASINWLEQEAYIKRLIISHKKGQRSLYRVYLPCEMPGSDSRTKLIFNNDQTC